MIFLWIFKSFDHVRNKLAAVFFNFPEDLKLFRIGLCLGSEEYAICSRKQQNYATYSMELSYSRYIQHICVKYENAALNTEHRSDFIC